MRHHSRGGHRGSPESKDSDEETRVTLERIEARLDRLAAQFEPPVTTYQGAGPPARAEPVG